MESLDPSHESLDASHGKLDPSHEWLERRHSSSSVARGVRDAVTERCADVGQRALGVYATAKGINRPNRKLSIVNVASLRRSLGHLGRGGRRKPAEGEIPDTTPTEKK